MAEKKSTLDEPTNQAISPADMAAGLQHEREIAVAQAVLESRIQAQQTFVAQIFTRYGVNPESYQLKSWLDGFEPVDVGEGSG